MAKRRRIQNDINDPTVRFNLLLAQQKVGGVGLNLQHDMHLAALFDQTESWEEYAQIIGRQWRLGQVLEVLVFTLTVRGTYDSKRIT